MSSQTPLQNATPPTAQPQEQASAAAEAPERKWLVLRYLLALGRWRLALLAALSLATGLAEAAVLAIVAQVAAALATRLNVVEVHLGVGSVHVSIRTLLIVGGAIAAIRLILLIPASS